MKNVLHFLTLTTAIAICAASAVLAQSSAEGEIETMSETPYTRNVAVPGVTIYVEQRGSGPTLLLIPGGAQDAGIFAALATELSDQFTVIALDPRCNSRSPCDDSVGTLTLDGKLHCGPYCERSVLRTPSLFTRDSSNVEVALR